MSVCFEIRSKSSENETSVHVKESKIKDKSANKMKSISAHLMKRTTF